MERVVSGERRALVRLDVLAQQGSAVHDERTAAYAQADRVEHAAFNGEKVGYK
jgi:hypothetical protein